jgi:hypothetical protein
MTFEFTGDSRTGTAIHLAHAAADAEVGTEHLLWGLLNAAPAVKQLLDAFDITPVVLTTVLKGRTDDADGTEQVDDEVTVADRDRPTRFGPGSKAALIRCAQPDKASPVTPSPGTPLPGTPLPGTPSPGTPSSDLPLSCTPERLLAAILADDRSRAVAVIRDCGVDPAEVRAALESGRVPSRPDRVGPDLRATRDRLIGRRRYRGRGLRDRVLSKLIPVKINYAAAPVMWVSLESDEIGRARGGAARTDDLLAAMLSTYEVAIAYPHLSGPSAEAYAGGRALADAGLRHDRLTEFIASADLGADGVRPRDILRRGGPWARDTGELLNAIIAHHDTRAVRLLDSLGADPRERR